MFRLTFIPGLLNEGQAVENLIGSLELDIFLDVKGHGYYLCLTLVKRDFSLYETKKKKIK